MTNEQLEAAMAQAEAGIKMLAEPGKVLTKEERKQQQLLKVRKLYLERIKEAKAKGRTNDEFHYDMLYALSETWWGKHLYLMQLIVNMKLWIRI